ncbi:MAG: Ava_C0101 and related proteins [uncultured Rubrobacteraceae bacterium]|uniref:Ava_C0101 and related proteins n=1 Tax=uncultured Rubrobacteraceae bacterium TaxID=349277 RepID=A0A6J4QMM7_9ACTN|nr:MAG: Ava_C0101 and related proteins [uncultured Rubrobacteraceae bacterium]
MVSPHETQPLPPLPFEEWKDTKETLHRYCQIVGKVRMALSPYRNHWWHVTLYVTTRGLTTGSIPYGPTTFDVSLDLISNRLIVTTSEDEAFSFAMDDLPVAEFYRKLFEGLGSLGIEISINPKPFDLDDGNTLDTNTYHHACDRRHVRRFHRALVRVDQTFKDFAGRFNGKTSPVQLFWHSFDLAVTRFSDRRVSLPEETDPVTREAYSHEVISFGFWPGDQNVREPAFYSYTAPEPKDLTGQPLRPPSAAWQEGGTALLTYEEVRNAVSPKETLLEFLQSAYEAGAKTAGWDMEKFRAG